jgi:dihydroorotate dehydrogenase (NAD+) catalytic subunit
MAGASAVQVGTASFVNPGTAIEVVDGIEAFLERHSIASVTEIVGCALPAAARRPA